MRMIVASLCAPCLWLAACPGGVSVGEGEGDVVSEGEGEGEGDIVGEGEGDIVGEGEGEDVVGVGTFDDPIVVDTFPFHDDRDTTEAPGPAADHYSCDDTIDESGDAFVYRIDTAEAGVLAVHVDDDAGAGVDVDVHLLSGPDANLCLVRNNSDASFSVEAGSTWLVVDSFVSGGVAQEGAFGLDITLTTLTDGGNCGVEPRTLEMVWGSCSGTIAGCDERVDGVFLHTPVTGPVVKEAHLVTVDDVPFFADLGQDWPDSFTQGIEQHRARTADVTGYAMNRGEPWAPAGEGGSEFGQGATGNPLPVVDEAWYVNMYWRDKPTPGTRMIIKNPANGRAVVASAGWETGPGDITDIGGVTEEIHDFLGTSHEDTLIFGFAVDQTLPFGPIECQ